MVDRYAFGVRRADSLLADIPALVDSVESVAGCGGRTVGVCVALDRRTTALVVGISYGSCGALALEGTAGVVTGSCRAAREVGAEVDQVTVQVGIAGVPGLAIADLSVSFGGTQRVLSARIRDQTGDFAHVLVAELVVGAVAVGLALHLLAADLVVVGEASEPRLAAAHRAVVSGGAFCVAAANNRVAGIHAFRLAVGGGQALFVVSAVRVRLTLEFPDADAVMAELIVGASGVGLASRLADVLDAELTLDAISGARTNRCKRKTFQLGRSRGKIILAYLCKFRFRILRQQDTDCRWRSTGAERIPGEDPRCFRPGTCRPPRGCQRSNRLVARKRSEACRDRCTWSRRRLWLEDSRRWPRIARTRTPSGDCLWF